MLYLVDSANCEAIAKILEDFPISGVTTNPSIVCREHGDYAKILKDVRSLIGPERMLHAQTLQKDADDMVREARAIRDLVGGEFYVKLPICPEALKATRILKSEGVGVTMTAIFSAQQALVAACAGADFVAPYVNKMDDVGNGCELVKHILEIYGHYELKTRVLAASFRNVEQVTAVSQYGAHSATLPPALYEKLIWHPMTDLAVQGFDRDWQAEYGDKKPLDLIG